MRDRNDKNYKNSKRDLSETKKIMPSYGYSEIFLFIKSKFFLLINSIYIQLKFFKY